MAKSENDISAKVLELWNEYSVHFKLFFMPTIEEMFEQDKAEALIREMGKGLADNVDYVSKRYGIDLAEYHKPRTVIID